MTHSTSESNTPNRQTYNVNGSSTDSSALTLSVSSAPTPVEPSVPESVSAVFLSKALSESAKQPGPDFTAEAPRSSALFKSSEELAVLRSNINLMADQLQGLLQKEEAEAAAARLLNHLTARLRESRSIPQLFSSAVTEARETLQADRVIVYTFNENWQGTVVAESVVKGWKAALGDKIADPCFADRYVEPYRRGRVSVTANIFEAGLTECHLGQLIPYGIRANLVVPILANQQLLGLLIAHQCSGPRNWHEAEVDFLSKLAIQVGYAYDQITVMETQATTAKQASLLNRISSRIRENLRPQEIFNVATQEIREAIQADRVIVYTFDEKWQGTVVAESVGRGWKTALGEMIADPCFAGRYVEPYRMGRVSATNNIYEAGLTKCHIGQLEPFEVKANLVVPILSEQKLYGLLIAHQCSGPRQWQETESDFLKQFALQMGFALDQAILLERQEKAAKNAQQLNQITARIREISSVTDVFSTVVEESREALQSDRVMVYTFDEQWKGTVVAESVGRGWKAALGDKVADPCFAERYVEPYRRGRVSATNNIEKAGLTDCHLGQLKPYGVKANLVVPIVANRKLFGLLIAHQCSAPRNWQPSEIDFLKQAAIQVGFAIDQVNLLEQQQALATQAVQLNAIVSSVRQSLKSQDIFETAVEKTQDAIQADRVIVYLFDDQWRGTVVAEAIESGYTESLGKMIVDPCFVEKYVKPYQKGRVHATSNIYEAGLTDCHIGELEPFQVKANLVAPILSNQKLYGLFIAHQCSGPRQWKATEIDLFRQIASQMGFALDQAIALESQKKQAAQAQLLNQLVFNIRKSLQTKAVFAAAVEGAKQVLNADRVIVYTFDEKWQGTVVAEAVESVYPEAINATIADPCFTERYVQQYQQGRVQAVNNVYEAGLTNCHIGQLEPFEVKANLVAPILANKKLHGLLIAHECSGPRQWKETEIEFFRQTAIQVGFAYEQAIALEKVQQSRRQAEDLSENQRKQTEELRTQIRAFMTDIQGSFDGDLTVRARLAEGEMATVGDFFNATIENLQTLVLQVKAATTAVSQVAQDSEPQVNAVSTEALRQSDTVAAALAQIQTMAQSIQSMALLAQQAQVQVKQGQQIVAQSDQAMNNMVTSIKSVQQSVEQTATKVKRLGEASQNIARIVSLIQDLAKQTNVLALNASLESQPTSEDDQDFSVIAFQVRTLAEQSAEAANEIETIVVQIQTETSSAVDFMEVSQRQVNDGARVVEESRQQLSQITDASNQVEIMVEAIAQSANNEVQTSVSLANTMQEVAAISTQTSCQSQTLMDSLSRLRQVTETLQANVSEFKV